MKSNQKKKICIINHFGYPLYNKKCRERFGGGAAVQLYLLTKELSKNPNLDEFIITGKYQPNSNKIEIMDNIKLYKVLPIKRRKINYIKGGIKLFQTLYQINPDIVIQRIAGDITGLCALYCKLFRKKFIFSIGIDPDVNGKSEKGLIGKLYKYGLDNADYIIAQNNDQIRLLQAFKKRKISNIRVIKSGYEIKNTSNTVKDYILWVGRAVDWKKPELFLELARRFPNEKFVIICYEDYDKNYWNSIYKEAFKISNLKFYKFIPFHQIDGFFSNAKVLINTSLYEGFPNTFIQAFKNRTPVISLFVNPDKILSKNKIGFACDNDFKKMEASLKQLLKNKELYESYAKNALSMVKINNDITKISKEWIALIYTLLN